MEWLELETSNLVCKLAIASSSLWMTNCPETGMVMVLGNNNISEIVQDRDMITVED